MINWILVLAAVSSPVMYFEIVLEVDMIYSEASLEETSYCNNHGCTVLELLYITSNILREIPFPNYDSKAKANYIDNIQFMAIELCVHIHNVQPKYRLRLCNIPLRNLPCSCRIERKCYQPFAHSTIVHM